MTLLDSALMAVIQGLTEFLPVSSSGHLVIAGYILDLPSEGILFEVTVHIGTLLAILAVYWSDIVGLLTGIFRRERESLRLGGLLILGSIPAAAAALFLGDWIETFFASPLLASIALLITGTVLFSTRFRPPGPTTSPGPREALLIGVCQALALVPGLSRSGLTISGGLLWGVRQDRAARFSFLLAVPAIAGAGLLKIGEIKGRSSEIMVLLTGLVVSAVVGYLALRMLLGFLRRGRFGAFSYYCWAAGSLGILLCILKG